MWFRERKLGRVCTNDMGLIIERDPDTVRGPDVALYTNAKKYEELSQEYPDSFPVLVVEVLSPHDRPSQTIRRLNRFLDKGSAIVWIVDPEARNVTVWWPGQAPLVLEANEELRDLPESPGFQCKVAEFFDAAGA
jgi:Uma2 family endonuclease